MNLLGPEWKYHITIYDSDWPKVQVWCEKNIGLFNKDWYKLGIDPMMNLNNGTTETTWYFKTKEHAAWFELRWS